MAAFIIFVFWTAGLNFCVFLKNYESKTRDTQVDGSLIVDNNIGSVHTRPSELVVCLFDFQESGDTL